MVYVHCMPACAAPLPTPPFAPLPTPAALQRLVQQVGPRSNFSTAFSTNAVSICTSTGLSKVTRLEQSRRFLLTSTRPLTDAEKTAFAAMVHDRMTEELYTKPVASFKCVGMDTSACVIPLAAGTDKSTFVTLSAAA